MCPRGIGKGAGEMVIVMMNADGEGEGHEALEVCGGDGR